ncbi:MAG: DUF488 domain-containing protein [Chloroflexi bacterium]|nr:DUF488 domain-containing protein [Chloroflexota bacterium]
MGNSIDLIKSNGPIVYTIGHSSHTLENFLSLLEDRSIEVVIETRSVPRSGYSPHFSAEPLQSALEKNGIEYRPWGNALGGKPVSSRFYDDEGYVLYSEIAATEEFQEALDRIGSEARRKNIVVMCSEENPANCHRHLLISRVLGEMGVEIIHIRGDGSLMSDEEVSAADSDESGQLALFDDDSEQEWKSTQSDSQRSRRGNFSRH